MNAYDEILMQETREQLIDCGSTEDDADMMVEAMKESGLFDVDWWNNG